MNILRKTPRFALALALLFIVWLAIAMFGAKLGMIDKIFAFGTMTIGWGLMMAGVIGVLAIIGLLVAIFSKPRQGWLAALVALAVPLGFFGGLMALQAKGDSVPFIYDITTNTADAPQYSAAMVKARADSGEGVNELLDFGKPLDEYEKWAKSETVASKTAAQLIAEGYPDLETLVVQNSVEDVLTAVESAMTMRGFDGVTADKEAGTVEGTDEVFWYGFQDDVVARIRAVEGGTSIDFRSTSRIGTSDLGVNAERIADLSKAVEDRLAKDFPKLDLTVSTAPSAEVDQVDESTGEAKDDTAE